MSEQSELHTVLEESRLFPPSEEFVRDAHVSGMDDYETRYRESLDDPEKFWGEVANELTWLKPWERVLDESEAPFFKWFTGGRTNISINCIDRHLESATRNKAASLSGLIAR